MGADTTITRFIYWYGIHSYEGSESRWWVKHCENSHNILEIGANIGLYTVLGARAAPNSTYRAVEPQPQAISLLQRNLALNNIYNVQIIPCAVVAEKTADSLPLLLPAGERYTAATGAFLAESGSEMTRVTRGSVRVDLIAMADLIDEVDLIKLDIEGLEASVLNSVLPQILRSKPVIFLEVLPGTSRLRGVVRSLVAGGYLAYGIGQSSLHLITIDEIAEGNPLPRYHSYDIILVPAGRVP